MFLQTTVDEADGVVTFTVEGEWDLDAITGLIDQIASECRARNCRRALANCLSIRIQYVLEYERFVAGKHIAAKLQGIRSAAVFPAEHINNFAEAIAVSEGADFLVTADLQAAEAWVRQERRPSV